MQQLHLVGFTTDLDSLILSSRKGTKSGGFMVRLDDHVLELIAEALRRRAEEGEAAGPAVEAPPPRRTQQRQSLLSPREIQARLRAGRSVAAVAGEAAVDEEWVRRFAAPVAAERSQVVGRVRQLVYAKPRRGESAEPLGTSVRWNLADRGVRLTDDEFTSAWSAYQVADHTWMVTFDFESRRRSQHAEWEVDLDDGYLVARNRLASDLGYVESGRRRRSVASLMPERPPADGNRTEAAAHDEAPAPSHQAPARAARRGAPAKRPADAKPARNVRGANKATSTKRAVGRTPPLPVPSKRAPAENGRSRSMAASDKAGRKKAQKSARSPRVAPKKPGEEAARRVGGKKAARPSAAVKKTPSRTTGRTTSRTTGRPSARPTASGASRTERVQGRGRSGGKGPAEPAPAPPPTSPAQTELERRRMEIVRGQHRPGAEPSSPRGGPGSGTGAARPAPTRPSPAPPAPAPAPRQDPGPGPEPEGPPETRAAEAPEERAIEADAPDAGLDVFRPEPVAGESEVRRAERRRARETARGDGDEGGRSAGPLDAGQGTGEGGPGLGDIPEPAAEADEPVDTRVVTIRAKRATPPVGEDEAEIILPPNRPPLRPAQPAAVPRRRRFGRR